MPHSYKILNTRLNTYIETPLSVGISLDLHTITRSEQLVDEEKNIDLFPGDGRLNFFSNPPGRCFNFFFNLIYDFTITEFL